MGGLRLVQATCKKFYEFCDQRGIALPRRNFTLSYDTNIPRQVGLAGSSAIVTATLNCLMRFFNLSESDLPKPIRSSFILNVEMDELFIQAGLQDRVIQVYEGLVYMDFDKKLFEDKGHGDYVPINVNLPQLFLAYSPNPSDSGRIHSNVKQRWLAGDTEIIEGMKYFGQIVDKAKTALESENWDELKELMNANFEQRRKLYTDHCLGGENLKMIAIARQFEAAAKFSGSGGAIVGLLTDQSKKTKMKEMFNKNGFVYLDLMPNYPKTDEELKSEAELSNGTAL